MHAGTHRPPPVPKLWLFLAHDWLALRTDLVHSWWQALGKSADASAQALVQAVMTASAHPYPAQQTDATRQAVITQMAPDVLVQGVEELVEAKLLLRREASQIEECILRKLDATGQWRP